jgi:hypothetical protein
LNAPPKGALPAPKHVFEEAYLWGARDPDTPLVLVPCSPREYNVWVVIPVRVRGLKVPERWTEEGKRVAEEVRRRLLLERWTRVRVETHSKSFDRWVGDVWVPERGRSYGTEVEKVMEDLGIEPGGL